MTSPLQWTPALEAEVKRLWLEGESAGLIAARLGSPFTRNAVMGKVFRAGLARRPGFVSSNLKRARKVIPPKPPRPPKPEKAPKVVVAPKIAAAALVIDPATARPWTERRRQECAYLTGDDMACCGSTERGQSYCAGHRAILYRPTPNLRANALAKQYG